MSKITTPSINLFLNDATGSKASGQEGPDIQANTDSTNTLLHLPACQAESYKLHILWKLN